MNKFLLDKGGYMQEMTVSEGLRNVTFPVYLAVKHGDSIEEYHDFILDIAGSWIFVNTESPLPEGTSLLMHFYIPPDYKLLEEIRGKVATMKHHKADYPKGMIVKFGYFSDDKLKNLVSYVEGKKHLIDKMA